MGCRCTMVAEVVQMASRFEEEYNQYVSGHSKGKAKLPFTSQFSVSSPPSSSGMSSPRKRKKDRSGGGSGARRSFARGSGGVGPASSAQHSFAGVGSIGSSKAASSGQGNAQCFQCGQAGHFAAYYPRAQQVTNRSGVVCYNCGRSGHVQRMCPDPPKRAGNVPQQPTWGRVFTISAPDCGPSGNVVEGKSP